MASTVETEKETQQAVIIPCQKALIFHTREDTQPTSAVIQDRAVSTLLQSQVSALTLSESGATEDYLYGFTHRKLRNVIV